MTDVVNPPSAVTSFRVQRARQLREQQLNRAAVAQVAPDATGAEREDLLLALRHDQPASPARSAKTPPRKPDPADGELLDERAFDAKGQRRRRRPRLPRAFGRLLPRHRKATVTVSSPGAEPVPDELASIPRPGRRRAPVGRTRSWITRLTLIAAPLILIGGAAYSCGVAAGTGRLTSPGVLSTDEASRYHLSTFPADRASSFAAAYLTLCLTHPNPADTEAVTNRAAGLAQMSSAGVAPGCGWTGTTTDPPPLAVVWNGVATPLGGYTTGAGASIGFVVTTADGRTVTATVPVWVSATSTARGMRVVGDVALFPAVSATPAPTPVPPATTDTTLAGALPAAVLAPFLRAWAASDPVQLGLVLAPSATAAARSGLAGGLRGPQINNTQVHVDAGTPEGYLDGDRVTANVSVDWATPAGGTQRTGYSIGLQRIAGRWLVTDIAGAAPDPAGGLSPSTTFATPTPATPPAG